MHGATIPGNISPGKGRISPYTGLHECAPTVCAVWALPRDGAEQDRSNVFSRPRLMVEFTGRLTVGKLV